MPCELKSFLYRLGSDVYECNALKIKIYITVVDNVCIYAMIENIE